ncbi:NUDIX domain-containing protein [Piscirickettsia litoralis]|uniref:ADP-ribose pyrophosphatase n=1 Tax=Piscirickettsia litoralis TaxID=1891921 RepID=A0ABX3A0F9_9GAMM|nr:NUDIX domain-containing protein [Piscirickettsia litoralis]ODN42341.1 ADP-ribose pyrophosphatase [Piscirickettsia litoralis]
MPKHVTFLNKDAQILKEKELYTGFLPIKKYHIRHKTFDGSTLNSVEREVMTRRDAVAAIVYDPNEKLIVLLEQFRVGALNDPKTPWLFEIVAGLIETGESHESVARREIHEETGLNTLDSLNFIQSFYTSPGGISEQVHLFSATADLKNCPKEAVYGLSTEQEDIKRHIISFDECFELLKQGTIRNSIAIIAIQWLQQQVLLKAL